jgi:anti-anti-sigma factor
MAIKNWSDNIVIVNLHEELRISAELKSVNEIISNRDDCDVIMDFSDVDIVTSSDICNLIILHTLLHKRGRRLILCNVAVLTKCIFTVAGLDELFDFADDKDVQTVIADLTKCQLKAK